FARACEALATALRRGGGETSITGGSESEITFHTQLETVMQNAPIRKLEPGEGEDVGRLVPSRQSAFIHVHALARQPLDVGALPARVRAGLSALSEDAASWLSQLASSLTTDGPIPAHLRPAATVHELEEILAESDLDGDTRGRLQLRMA